jgi:formate dehydrogenase (hydrogenase)
VAPTAYSGPGQIVPQHRLFHHTELFRFAERPASLAARWLTKVGGMVRHQHRPLERLTEPLVRDNGVLRPASWDEALSRAADGFRAARDTLGGNSIGFFSCSKSTNEMNFIAQKLARAVMGTNNIDSCNRT